MKSANNWPKSDYRSMVEFYGNVGHNQTKLKLPFPLRLSWEPEKKVKRITVHRHVAESMHGVLETILHLYGYNGIRELHLDNWGGCLNVRRMRGGTSYSMHSWGAANDWFPAGNPLRKRWDQSVFSDPEYIDFLNAWIYAGWNPIGISKGYDAMHIEATANNVQPLASGLYRAA